MSQLIFEAGCKTKNWTHDYTSYQWVAAGELLERGVCIGTNYRKYLAPEQGRTRIHSTIEYQTVRNVDAKDQTLSFDLTLTLRWLDPNIQTHFTEADNEHQEIILSPEATQKIWTPDMFIWNRTSVTSTSLWASLVHGKILTSKEINEEEAEKGEVESPLKTTVEMKYVIKTTIYCSFEYTNYPMDTQNCSVKIGSSSFGAIFTLFDKENIYHTPKTYASSGLNIQIAFFGQKNSFGNSTVGFHVQMSRLTQPFLMMYYIPAIAIVLVSELGFVVPLTADGSVGLLVTQLLTLVNLFIYQMVRIFHY